MSTRSYKYEEVPASDKSSAPETLDDGFYSIEKVASTRSPRRTRILIFICGVFVGIAATYAVELILKAILDASQQSARQKEHQVTMQVSRANDTWTADDTPLIDPICGKDWREAEAAGCRYDIMGSRWYSPQCFHEDVLEQMLSEVEFDWVSNTSEGSPNCFNDLILTLPKSVLFSICSMSDRNMFLLGYLSGNISVPER